MDAFFAFAYKSQDGQCIKLVVTHIVTLFFISLFSVCFDREGVCFSAPKGDGDNPDKAVAENTLDIRRGRFCDTLAAQQGLDGLKPSVTFAEK